MSKFNVGDRVRVVPPGRGFDLAKAGDEGTVRRAGVTGNLNLVEFQRGNEWAYDREIELVMSAAPAAPEFRVGDRVRTRGTFSFDPNEGVVAEVDGDIIVVTGIQSSRFDSDDRWNYFANELSLIERFEAPVAKFKVGDRVRLVVSKGELNAQAGAEGVVGPRGVFGHYLDVVWDRATLGEALQMDGGYRIEDFVKVEAPAARFKVGDRVRAKRDIGEFFTAGQRYVVVRADHEANYFTLTDDEESDHSTDLTWLLDNFDLVPTAESTIRLEAGKFYRTQDGRKVGPAEGPDSDGDIWVEGVGYYDLFGRKTGYEADPAYHDHIVAEWVDEPSVRFKVGDRVTKPCWGWRESGYPVVKVIGEEVWLDPETGDNPVPYVVGDDMKLVRAQVDEAKPASPWSACPSAEVDNQREEYGPAPRAQTLEQAMRAFLDDQDVEDDYVIGHVDSPLGPVEVRIDLPSPSPDILEILERAMRFNGNNVHLEWAGPEVQPCPSCYLDGLLGDVRDEMEDLIGYSDQSVDAYHRRTRLNRILMELAELRGEVEGRPTIEMEAA